MEGVFVYLCPFNPLSVLRKVCWCSGHADWAMRGFPVLAGVLTVTGPTMLLGAACTLGVPCFRFVYVVLEVVSQHQGRVPVSLPFCVLFFSK